MLGFFKEAHFVVFFG